MNSAAVLIIRAEQFDFNRWQSAFADVGLSPEDFVRQRTFEEVLPWII